MKRIESRIFALLLLLGLLVATERRAEAYTDPGTGALLLQSLGAVFVGFMFYLRRFRGWLRNGRRTKE